MSEKLHWSVKYCHMDRGELMKRINELEKKLAEAHEEIVTLHNPHTGNECDCDICNSYGKRGER